MHYQLFIPSEERRTAADHLVSVGCGHLLEGVQNPQQITGPNGEKGVLLSWMTNAQQLNSKYEPELQSWVPAQSQIGWEKGRYWVGWNDVSPPTPDDLQRRYPFPSEWVELGSGYVLAVPIADRLPYDMIRDDDGTTKYYPQRNFAEFAEAAKIWQGKIELIEAAGDYIFEEMRDFVELGLRANYRYLPEIGDAWVLWQKGQEQSTHRAFLAALKMLTPDRIGGRDG